MLRGKKPEYKPQRFKAFFYGKAKAGKTWAAIHFPTPYIIDSEGGMNQQEYIDIINSRGGSTFETDDFDEVYQEIKTLMSTEHQFKTLVIDSLTVVYNSLCAKCAQFLSKNGKDGTEFGRNKAMANQLMGKLMLLLFRIDMNVIIISHSKNEYAGSAEVVSQTFDCYPKLDYVFDLILRIERRGKNTRKAFIEGSRIKSFPELELIDFSYEEITNRYPLTMIEKTIAPEILVSHEKLTEFLRLVELLNVPEEITDKWLKIELANSFDEIKDSRMDIYLNQLNKKLKGEANV